MDGEANNERWGWGLSASVAAHALVAALVIFGLPKTLLQPQQEEVVSVTIEPPPEKPPEPAKAAPPPPPPAEPAKEPPPPAQTQAAAPIAALNPVVKFGEKDAGPRQALAGAGAEDNPDPPAVADEPKILDEAKPETPDRDEEPPAAETETAEAKEPGEAGETTGSAAEPLVATAAAAPDKAAPPAPSTPSKAKAAAEPKLREARKLFSRSADGGATATTAMANVPRGIRAGRLCLTELRLQLLNGSYFPELLPYYELKNGTVLTVRRSGFRAGGAWHSLAFECQVDQDATSVVSFAFRVGDALSREEISRRRLSIQ
jgi:hypothetical protein